MKIKVSELFYSLQGEGLHIGVPSVFMRIFGCNFRCRGFGMPKGELSDEFLQVDPKKYKSYDELPLVHTGCDSYPSWDPRFKNLSPMLEVEEICDRIQAMLPNGKFGWSHMIFTGGEPLLGWQRAYPELIEMFVQRDMDLGGITFETNGTQKLQSYLYDCLDTYSDVMPVTFSISSKLSNSGELWEEAIRPDVIETYQRLRRSKIVFKWVCSSPEDFADVQKAEKQYKDAGIRIDAIYLMPAGGTELLYHKNKQWLSKICMAHGYRYSPRLQIDLFGNQWAT